MAKRAYQCFEMQDWPDLSRHIIICIESLELELSVQQDAAIQNIFVMYNFLPQFCQSAHDQCTRALPKRPGNMQYSHAAVSPFLPDFVLYAMLLILSGPYGHALIERSYQMPCSSSRAASKCPAIGLSGTSAVESCCFRHMLLAAVAASN